MHSLKGKGRPAAFGRQYPGFSEKIRVFCLGWQWGFGIKGLHFPTPEKRTKDPNCLVVSLMSRFWIGFRIIG
jgi:hypothetical protein